MPIRYGIVIVTASPAVLTNNALNGENIMPHAKYSTESGRTTVRLFNAKNVSITTIASSVLSGVYSIIVSTVNGCPDFLTITVSIIPIIQIAITGIIFLKFFILYHLSHQRYL